MADDLKTMTDRLAAELSSWLDQPTETGKKLASVREQLEGMKGEIGAEIINSTLKPLEQADKAAKRARQREAAEAIAAACKQHGVILIAGEPHKRSPRPPKKKPERKPEAPDADGSPAGQ